MVQDTCLALRRPETVRGVPALQPLPNDDDVSKHGGAEEDERKRLSLQEVAFEHNPPLLLLKLLQFLQFAHSSPPGASGHSGQMTKIAASSVPTANFVQGRLEIRFEAGFKAPGLGRDTAAV